MEYGANEQGRIPPSENSFPRNVIAPAGSVNITPGQRMAVVSQKTTLNFDEVEVLKNSLMGHKSSLPSWMKRTTFT